MIGWALLMSELLLDGCDDGLFDLAGRDPRDRSKPGCSGLSMNAGLRHIIAITDACLGGVGCEHAMAGIVEQEVPEEVVRRLPGQCLMGLMGRQLVLHRLKQALVHDRRLFPRQDLAHVVDLTNKEAVAKEVGERPVTECPGGAVPDVCSCPGAYSESLEPGVTASHKRRSMKSRRAADGGRYRRTSEPQPTTSLYARASLCVAEARPRRTEDAALAQRRSAQSKITALGLRIPHAVSVSHRDLRDDCSSAGGGGAWPLRGLYPQRCRGAHVVMTRDDSKLAPDRQAGAVSTDIITAIRLASPTLPASQQRIAR